MLEFVSPLRRESVTKTDKLFSSEASRFEKMSSLSKNQEDCGSCDQRSLDRSYLDFLRNGPPLPPKSDFGDGSNTRGGTMRSRTMDSSKTRTGNSDKMSRRENQLESLRSTLKSMRSQRYPGKTFQFQLNWTELEFTNTVFSQKKWLFWAKLSKPVCRSKNPMFVHQRKPSLKKAIVES